MNTGITKQPENFKNGGRKSITVTDYFKCKCIKYSSVNKDRQWPYELGSRKQNRLNYMLPITKPTRTHFSFKDPYRGN